jgi:chromosome segregation ATPase
MTTAISRYDENAAKFEECTQKVIGRYDNIVTNADHSALVDQVAVQSYQIKESEDNLRIQEEGRKIAETEVLELKALVRTLELSVEQHAKFCAELTEENKEMKAAVKDFQNRLIIARNSEEILVANNATLSMELSDAKAALQEDSEKLIQLKRELKSHELLAESQPSFMYAEVSPCCEHIREKKSSHNSFHLRIHKDNGPVSHQSGRR